MPIAVVTGAGSGLGQYLALTLAKNTYTVYGTAFNQNEVEQLYQQSEGKVILKLCDITKQDDIDSFSKFVNEQESNQLDLLINNAGILTPGPIEILPIESVYKEFDVNTFGLLRIVNAFLPSLRLSQGRIVQISTVSVDQPSPFNAPSSASKAAAEIFTELYGKELEKFGITTSIAVCGNMQTGGPKKVQNALDLMLSNMSNEEQRIYGDEFKDFSDRIMAGQNQGLDPQIAAEEIFSLVNHPSPPLRVAIGDDARQILKQEKF